MNRDVLITADAAIVAEWRAIAISTAKLAVLARHNGSISITRLMRWMQSANRQAQRMLALTHETMDKCVVWTDDEIAERMHITEEEIPW
jgi:hypothetical protein